MTFFQKHLEKNMRLEKFREKSNSSQNIDKNIYYYRMNYFDLLPNDRTKIIIEKYKIYI